MKNKLLPFLLLLPLISACTLTPRSNNNGNNNNDPVDPADPVDPEPTEPTVDPIVDDKPNIYENSSYSKEFLDFFSPDSKVEVELDFTNESIFNLKEYGQGEGNSNFDNNEMYHPCTAKITVNGVTKVFEEVGARMKGNMSRNNTQFVDSSGHFDQGQLCHFKINFGQAFDDPDFYYVHDWNGDKDAKKARENREFAEMKKIDFKWNRNFDTTFTKEAYALEAFREVGVIAQHSNLVKLTVKSESDSFTQTYLAYETVDKKMLKKISDDNKGDLYKCTYTDLGPATLTNANGNVIGIEGQNYRPIYNLKSNEKTSDFSIMKNFIKEVVKSKKNDGLDGAAYYDNISKYLDVDNFLRYSALCWVFGMPDDLRNNYNNYYIYFNKGNKAMFIPYDNDRVLGIKWDWPKDLKNVKYDDPNCWGEQGNFNQCPLVLRLLSGGSNNTHPVSNESKTKFFKYCKEYANKYLSTSRFNEYTSRFYYAPTHDINYVYGMNDTFATYAKAKLATIN